MGHFWRVLKQLITFSGYFLDCEGAFKVLFFLSYNSDRFTIVFIVFCFDSHITFKSVYLLNVLY